MTSLTIPAKKIIKGDDIINLGIVKQVDEYANAIVVKFDYVDAHCIVGGNEFLTIVYKLNQQINIRRPTTFM